LIAAGVVGATAAAAGCSDELEGSVTPAPDAGDARAKKDDLYTRLGGDVGVSTIVEEIFAAEMADTAIASYFYAQDAVPHDPRTPTVTQVKRCFVHMIKADTTDPKVDDYGNLAKNDGWACRDMAKAHAHLHVSNRDFDRFTMTAIATLTGLIANGKLEVSSTELIGLVNFFEGNRAAIVDVSRGDAATGSPLLDSGASDDGGRESDASH